MPNLMLLFTIPFLASLLVLIFPVWSGKLLQKIAITLSFIPLIILIVGHSSWIGSHIEYPWIPSLAIEFHLSIDPLTLVFLYLTAFIIPISLLASIDTVPHHPNTFYALVLLLEGLLIGFFTARDLVLFTLFWESMLLPLYFMIVLWGGKEKEKAALKFIVYMIAGSALLISAVLALYLSSANTSADSSFNFEVLAKTAESNPYAAWLAAIFLLAFCVKTPLFPFHAWLPDAYCQASTTGTILLSAILSKAGIYGILRISMEFFPTYMQMWSPILLGFAIAGVIYGAFAAWTQSDFKRLLAYSSFSHVNFVLVGVFVISQTAQSGAILQALNHGVTIAALFLVAGWLEQRISSTSIGLYHGLAKYLPQLCWVTLFFVCASVALPGTNNFVGEVIILFGLFEDNPWLAALLATSVVLSVIYMLRWMQKVYFEMPSPRHALWHDMTTKELLIAMPLIAVILWIGIYPAPLLNQIKPAAEKIVSIASLEVSE